MKLQTMCIMKTRIVRCLASENSSSLTDILKAYQNTILRQKSQISQAEQQETFASLRQLELR